MLLGHAERVGASLRRHGLRGRTVTLKVKFADFRQITRSRTLPEATDSTETLYETGTALLEAEALPQPVRLIGLGVSGLGNAPTQKLLPGVFRGVQGRDPRAGGPTPPSGRRPGQPAGQIRQTGRPARPPVPPTR